MTYAVATRHKRISPKKNTIWVAICFALPIIIFLGLLTHYVQNIPATDDFEATLRFVYRFYYEQLTPNQRLKSLFVQHNEHRILISRLLALALYNTTGEVSFVHFLFVDILFLIGLLSLVMAIYRSVIPELPWYHYLLPLLFLLSPHSYETFLFVSGSSQSYPVLFFTTLSIWLLYRALLNPEKVQPVLFCLALVSGWLATFSFGSGFLVWAGGALFLYYKRHWTLLAAWLVMGLMTTGYYAYDFQRPANNLALTNPFSTQLIAFAKGILLFPGAGFMVHWPNFRIVSFQVVGCYAIGIVSWVYIVYLTLTGYGRKNPLLFSLLFVSLSVGFILSLSRVGVGSGFMFTSRYLVFTSMTPILLYAIALDQQLLRIQRAYWPVVGAYLLFLSSLWTSIPSIETIYSSRQLGFREWQRTGKHVLYIDPAMQQDADQIIRQSIEKHIFVPSEDTAR